MTKRQKEFEEFWLKVGRESGQLEKWRQEIKLETARNLQNMGFDADIINRATGLSPADIAAL
jgi:predicted transposase/invertase (TIGR01784 family)